MIYPKFKSLIIISFLFIVACGSGGDSAKDTETNTDNPASSEEQPPQNETEPTLTTPDTSISTQLITDYMKVIHDQEKTATEEDYEALLRDLRSRGLACGGAQVEGYIDNLDKHIQNFIDSSLNYIIKTNQTMYIDKPAIKMLFNEYKNIDLAYMISFAKQTTCSDWASSINYISNELTPKIDNMYEVALLEIDIL